MIINSANLQALRVGFQSAFKAALEAAPSQYTRVATVVPSTTKEERYGWLGKAPSMREWLGQRVVQNMSEFDYSIKNKDFELTIGVGRNDIQDDNLGVYGPLFNEMGQSAGSHPDQLTYALLKAGFASNCYDGQYFFDTDHTYIDAAGAVQTWANTDGGAGTPWFLLSTKRALKPLIFQERQKPTFVAKDNPNDDNVFMNKEFIYGVDGRWNVGYGFPQMAWGSKQTLDGTSYGTARAAMMGFKGDGGRPLGIVPDLLVVPPSLESNARKLLNSEYGTGGVTNEWKGTAELLVVPWLA